MKLVHKITFIFLFFSFFTSCETDQDKLYSFDYIPAPGQVSAIFDITQDNTGMVSIIPNSEGAQKFEAVFGDVDGQSPIEYKAGETITHIYPEGVFTVQITAVGITGLRTEYSQEINVAFKAPENLVINVENDPAVSKQVNISATADYATVIEYYFGELAEDTAVIALPDETVSHVYAEAGDYDITVIAKSAAIATLDSTFTFTVTEIKGPQNKAPSPPNRTEANVISVFSDKYANIAGVNFNPNWGQSTIVNKEVIAPGDSLLKYSNLNYQGTEFASMDVSGMEYLHVDLWTEEAIELNFYLISPGPAEKAYSFEIESGVWKSYDIPLSHFSDVVDLSDIFQFKVDGTAGSTVYFDNIYFYKEGASFSGLTGVWKMAPEAGSFGVGPAQGDLSWWAIDEAGVTDRVCFFDDKYIFNADGSFTNELDSETWIEGWQGGSDACGAPVAPHDGTAQATYIYDETAGTVTVNGTGAYLGIPKAYNGGELASPGDAPESITYIVELSENNTVMTLDINVGGDAWWRFKLERELAAALPLTGQWQMAPEAGSFGVGPGQGDMSWWAIDEAGVTDRACFFDDIYEFGSDGSFSNIPGSETWIEGWQGGSDACGAPVPPHDGAAQATYSYDETAGTVTVIGTGAYLGIPKAYNGGELASPGDAPESITYLIELSENNTVMTLDINVGGEAWWRFKLIKI